MDIKQTFIDLCLEQINILNKNINRDRYKPKYSNEYFLNHI